MALPYNLTPEAVVEACSWGFLARLRARRKAASGDQASAVLLVAYATAKSLIPLVGRRQAPADTVKMLEACKVVVEYG